MRVGLIRQDLPRMFIQDLEQTSQRNFSSQPPGQTRYIEYPTSNELTSVLNQYAFLSALGASASDPLTISGSNDTLNVFSSASVSSTITVTHAAYSAAALAAYLNAQFLNLGLLFVASVQGGQIQIDTVAPASPYVPSFATAYTLPSPPLGLSHEHYFVNPLNSGPTAYMKFTGNLATALGGAIATASTAIVGLPVAATATSSVSLKGIGSNLGVYQYTNISGQTGAAGTTAAALGANGTVTVGGLTGMTANSVLHYLTLTGGSAGNDGTFQIVQYISATSVVIANATAVASDSSLTWHEQTVSFNISYSQIGALSTFVSMEGYSATVPTGSFLALATAIQNAIAPSLVETGPVLLSFAKGNLSVMVSSYFQPGYPAQGPNASPFGGNESAISRLGYAMGPAVFITENDGSTTYSL